MNTSVKVAALVTVTLVVTRGGVVPDTDTATLVVTAIDTAAIGGGCRLLPVIGTCRGCGIGLATRSVAGIVI